MVRKMLFLWMVLAIAVFALASPAEAQEIGPNAFNDSSLPPYPRSTPLQYPSPKEPTLQSCRAQGRLIVCGDGLQTYDSSQRALISRGWTQSYASYKSVEIWVWWWNGTRWEQKDWRKAETNTGTYIEIVSRLGREWIPGGWYTMTSRHHARNSIFDQETIDVTSYPLTWVP